MLAVLGWVLCFIGRSGSVGDDKMVGGRINVDISKTPYVVSIHLDDPAENKTIPVLWDPICVGTIITALYVVTACHCVVGEDADGQVYSLVDAFPLEKWAFLAGAWDLRDPDYALNPATQIRTPEFIRHHPKCQAERTPWLRNNVPINDAAVARMARPFDVDNNVQPVKIFSFSQVEFKRRLDDIISDEAHTRCSVSGWGSTWDRPIIDALTDVNTTKMPAKNYTAAFPDEDRYKLKFLKVQARYEVDCLDALVRAIKNHVGPYAIDWDAFEKTFREKLKNQVCASNKNSSPCRGDSGSGLICDHEYIIGINSFGLGCGTSAPDVFQSVLAILGWLEEVVCDMRTCIDVKHLHSECDLGANKALVETCLTTEKPLSSIPKMRAGTHLPMSVAPIVFNSRWLIIVMVNVA